MNNHADFGDEENSDNSNSDDISFTPFYVVAKRVLRYHSKLLSRTINSQTMKWVIFKEDYIDM